METRSAGRRRLLTTVCLAVVCVAAPQAARAQTNAAEGACGPEFPAQELCLRAGLDTIRATYLFVVDQSQSMEDLWGSVRDALGSLVDAVPRSDRVRLVFFDGDAEEHSEPWDQSSETRSRWRDRIRQLPAPRGRNTDLGASLAEALRILRAEPSNQQQFVFFLTDGDHDPPSSSPYDVGGASPGWRDLAEEAAALSSARPIRFTVIRLREGIEIGALRRAVPQLSSVNAAGRGALSEWFATLGREFQVEKLLLAIERDLERDTVRLILDHDGSVSPNAQVSVTVSVENPMALVGVVLAATDWRLGDASEATIGIDGVEVPPSSTGPTSGRLRDSSSAWFAPPRFAAVAHRLPLSTRVSLTPSEELARIGLAQQITLPVVITARYRVGGVLSSWWTFGPAVLAALVFCFLALQRIRWAAHRPDFKGWRLVEPGSGPRAEGEIRELHGRVVRVNASGRELFTLNARARRGRTVITLQAPSEPSSIELEPKHADPDDLRRGNRIIVELDGGQVEYQLL